MRWVVLRNLPKPSSHWFVITLMYSSFWTLYCMFALSFLAYLIWLTYGVFWMDICYVLHIIRICAKTLILQQDFFPSMQLSVLTSCILLWVLLPLSSQWVQYSDSVDIGIYPMLSLPAFIGIVVWNLVFFSCSSRQNLCPGEKTWALRYHFIFIISPSFFSLFLFFFGLVDNLFPYSKTFLYQYNHFF